MNDMGQIIIQINPFSATGEKEEFNSTASQAWNFRQADRQLFRVGDASLTPIKQCPSL